MYNGTVVWVCDTIESESRTMEKMDKNSETTGHGAKVIAESVRMSRRRLLKAGAAAAPVVITLQSGTAWAQSMSCADRVVFPVVNDENREELRKLLNSVGAGGVDVEGFMSQRYIAESGPIHDAQMAYLQAEVASCWSSVM